MVHAEVDSTKLEAAVLVIAFLFIVVGVHFLYFVTGEDQVSVVCGVNLVRHLFCGVVDIAFMACVVFILFVHFLSRRCSSAPLVRLKADQL